MRNHQLPSLRRIFVHLFLLNVLSIVASSQTASFLSLDTATQGSWKGKYGADGYIIAGDGAKNPTYVTPTIPSNNWTWTTNTSETRALEKANGTGRIASTWYGYPTTIIDLNFTDALTHQVAIYCLDWDNNGPRTQSVEILDSNNNVLDKRTISSFYNGQYLVWNLSGRVKIRATGLTTNSVIEGIFFGGVVGTGATAAFVKVDSTTQGNWKSAYGQDGYRLAGDGVKNPAYVTPTVPSNTWTWTTNTSETRALEKASGTGRIASTWYGYPTTIIDLNFTDALTHQVAIYCLDWDNNGPRTQSVEILDSNNNVLDKRTISSFYNGQYLVWNLSGRVSIRATGLTTNSVIEGIFFGGVPAAGATATFVKVDATTQGNWKSAYGQDGYRLAGDGAKNPTYVTPTVPSNNWTWTTNTSETRALEKANGTGRIASTWYGYPTTIIDLNFTDTLTHQVAIYCLDWDNNGPRTQSVEILDSNNNVLDKRTISSFYNGQYLVWNLSGKVRIRATGLTTNSVIEGIFFGSGDVPIIPVAPLPIPQLKTWESNMTANATRFCSESEINSAIGAGGVTTEGNVWYYDGAHVYSQIAEYTKNPSWLTCAGYSNQAYRNWVLTVTAGASWPVGALNPWRIFPHGLLADYRRSGNSLSKTAIQKLAYNSAAAAVGGGTDCITSRETAYMMTTYLAAEAIGEPRNPLLAASVNFALGHIDQWFVSKTCPTLAPFMVGLTMEALIEYYAATADPRIPPAIALAAEELWNRAWLPNGNAFYLDSYYSTVAGSDLSLLIAPAYAWLWQRTGEAKYQERGDQIFAGGVLQAIFWSGKQFSQNYRSSFNYVRWRSAPARTLPLTSSP